MTNDFELLQNCVWKSATGTLTHVEDMSTHHINTVLITLTIDMGISFRAEWIKLLSEELETREADGKQITS